ncbi:MAG: glycosyltransferase family 1 protein [Bacteroidia bacterium]|nr:glycosyltransferase family 1 protein [Bacteroidia bacterium]
MKKIVVSAVNLRKGGTLTILKNCLNYLSGLSKSGEFQVIALVHNKELAFYEGIEYIEFPWTTKSWLHRLWCEYVTMHRISKDLSPVYLWFSLHDTTPRVVAERRAVYCQTSFPFYRWGINDLRFDYKIALFSMFTRFAYRMNIKQNNFLVVQQNWLREGFSDMFGIDKSKFIVAPPEAEAQPPEITSEKNSCRSFFYASTPDTHKNFELLCRATELLEREIGKNKFSVTITISGKENKYASWLYKKWSDVDSLHFSGFMTKEKLYEEYNKTDCLVFPSKIETWGLPISEFSAFGKPMLLADLPYSYETASNSPKVAFFDPRSPIDLKEKMRRLINGDFSLLKKVAACEIETPVAIGWEQLFDILLN